MIMMIDLVLLLIGVTNCSKFYDLLCHIPEEILLFQLQAKLQFLFQISCYYSRKFNYDYNPRKINFFFAKLKFLLSFQDRLLPPDQRCSYECEKEATGPIDRKKLIEHINKEAIETPDRPEFQPFVPGIIRGKKWIPPQVPKAKVRDDDIGTYELGDEYEKALNHASEEELVDLAAILGFHSMMNQDQYHASLLNKEKIGLGWDGVTKASKPKPAPVDPPNMTDPEDSIKRVSDDDAKLIALNWNNLNIRDEQFERLFKALEVNTRLEILSMSNTGMTDSQAEILAQAIEKNNSLRIVNIESNLLSGKGIIRLLKAMLTMNMIEEFRASNQRAQVLGNPAEMEITQLIERNTAILRLGLHLEYNDARSRVAAQLQRNIDRSRTVRVCGMATFRSAVRSLAPNWTFVS
ncbi:tropomodulin-1-like isoform X2 [Artemia franciscana]|uniref:tropomodulin-1-like isoform X2 n=1 Tax=Artemia franciscana TaxID=6661 RepID=UPI0032DB0D00